MLLGGVPGVAAGARSSSSAAASSGTNAARMAMGMEAHVTVLDTIADAAAPSSTCSFGGQLNTIYSTVDAIEQHVTERRSRHRRGAGARRRGAEAGDRAT